MQIRFTKMQGAGNDFVVLDETRARLGLTPAHYRRLADRHFGVGADQILSVRPAPAAGIDFEYVIHNADGGQVEQCGNGARCFAAYVRSQGLSDKPLLRVQTLAGVIELQLCPDGRVRVDMGRPSFDPARLPFDDRGLQPQPQGLGQKWPVALASPRGAAIENVALVSMGNPHAVLWVEDAACADVAGIGPLVQANPRFTQGVNVGFAERVQPGQLRLRVYERGAGETLACGSGACAAVADGIRLGLLQPRVDVQMRGGLLTIEWSGAAADSVFMTGPAVTVFQGSITLPDVLPDEEPGLLPGQRPVSLPAAA